MRIRTDPGSDGHVRLEQLAYSAGLGWYVQKSMTIPKEMLSLLLPELRKAQCLLTPQKMRWGQDSYRLSGRPLSA